MNKAAYAGVGRVFRFSLQQYFKQKSTFVMLLVMLLCSVGSVFIMSASMKRGQSMQQGAKLLFVLNESPYVLDMAELPDYAHPEIVSGDGETWLKNVEDDEYSVLLWIDAVPEGGWRVRACTGTDSKVSNSESLRLAAEGRSALRSAQLRAADATEEQLEAAFASYHAETVTQKDFLEPGGEEDGLMDEGRFLTGFIYAVVAFMLVSMSVSYVVRAVAEEKSSKLIDLLMVSVRPLALVWGKILAAMCVVLAGIVIIALGLGASRAILGVDAAAFTGGVSLGTVLSGLGAKSLACILVSLLLGYLCYSIMGGIAGSCSPGEEGTETASTAVTFLSMIGYFVGIATSLVGGKAVQYAVSLLPLLSAFTAPARYISGDIPFWMLLLSWAIQVAAVLFLGRFCAAVYGALLIHRGEKVKLGRLLAIFREQKGVRT